MTTKASSPTEHLLYRKWICRGIDALPTLPGRGSPGRNSIISHVIDGGIDLRDRSAANPRTYTLLHDQMRRAWLGDAPGHWRKMWESPTAEQPMTRSCALSSIEERRHSPGSRSGRTRSECKKPRPFRRIGSAELGQRSSIPCVRSRSPTV
jgi:hypothetical protein